MERLKREKMQLESAATKLLSLATKLGATDAEVCGAYSFQTKISLEKQDFHLAAVDDGFQIGLRVLKGEQQGFTSANTLDANDLKELVNRAVEIAQFSPKNPYQVILKSENIPREAPADLFDESVYQISLKTQKEWIEKMAELAVQDPRFRLNEGSLSIGASVFFVMNTKGTQKLEKETSISWSLMGMAVEGSQITSFDYFSELSRRKAKVQEKILESTKRFCSGVIANLQVKPARSYKGIVVFSPRATDEILISPLTHHLNGRNVVENTSRWKRDHLGIRVISEQVSLYDLPWRTDLMGATLFDREGTPTRNQLLIDNGVLKTILTDSYSAKALELPLTANAVGTTSTVPTVGSHSLSLAKGNIGVEKLLENVSGAQDSFLLVNRFSGQTDPITGDFSGVAKGAEWWENGRRAHFVSETLISGNLFECLGENLIGISQDTVVIDCQTEMPAVASKGVSVTTA